MNVEVTSHALKLGDRPARLALVHDVTDRVQAEKEREQLQLALLKASGEWRATFDSFESPILVLDESLHIIRLNRAAQRALGRGFDELIGNSLETIATGHPWASIPEAISKLRASGRPVSATIRGGDVSWELLAHGCRIPGIHSAFVAVLRDVTRLKELQQSLHRAQTMATLGALVAGVAHEVRNPLFSISATLDAFELNFGKEAGFAEYLGVLRNEVTRMNELMRDLLKYGKPTAMQLTPGALESVVNQAVYACKNLARQAGVEIVNELRWGLPEIDMDRVRLVEVFQNLVENAIQHTADKGTVRISAECNGDHVRCAIRDSGPGFKEEDLEHIFEPFFSRRRGGTGLGLAIVQRIVEEHGGEVIAANHPEGGALMTVDLPLAAGDRIPTTSEAHA